MNTEIVKLSQVKVNKHNPRTITPKKMEQLIVSLLVLPSMLELRPVVVDKKMTALGGNMRTEALNRIAKMSIEDIKGLLADNKDFKKKTDGEKNALLSHWGEWLRNPTIHVAKADRLSEAEKKQFMITDNASFGQWDFDTLANEWDEVELENWGVELPTNWGADEGKDSAQDGDIGNEATIPVLDVLFPSDNNYEIPTLILGMQAARVELPITPWGANSRLSARVNTYHFYVDDYRFEALFKDPSKLVNSGCKAIVEPNCSLHDQTPVAWGLQAIYKKRWLARYMQEIGVLVYADLNVSPKFRDYNRMGIPDGYNAFFTRGQTDMVDLLQSDLDVARAISGKDTPNLVIYGGGNKAERFCQKNGLLYVTDFINDKWKGGNGQE